VSLVPLLRILPKEVSIFQTTKHSLIQRPCYTAGILPNAADVACLQGLVAQQTLAALAGGVNVMLAPATTARICLLQALSPVGRCKTFEASGDGYGRGEAFTVMLLGYVPLAYEFVEDIRAERHTDTHTHSEREREQ
jgi:hypothetical protein